MIIPSGLKYRSYELVTTERCNLRCTYCFENWKCDQEDSQLLKDMDEKFLDAFIPFVMETKDNQKTIGFSFFGGEPTINWSFIEASIERLQKLNFNKYFSITTNCISLDSKKIDFLSKNFNQLILSIDGSREANINRIDAAGNNSWDTSISNATEILAKTDKRNVRVLMVVNKNNHEFLEKSYDFFVNKLQIYDVDILFDYSTEATEEYLDSIKTQLFSMFVKKRWTLPFTIGKKALSEEHKNKDFYCFHPELIASINSKGQLSFCHLLLPKTENTQISTTYGDIYRGIYDLDRYNEMLRRTKFSEWKRNKDCENCGAADWCKGGCIGSHFLLTKPGNFDILNPNLCKVHKIIDDISKSIK